MEPEIKPLGYPFGDGFCKICGVVLIKELIPAPHTHCERCVVHDFSPRKGEKQEKKRRYKWDSTEGTEPEGTPAMYVDPDILERAEQREDEHRNSYYDSLDESTHHFFRIVEDWDRIKRILYEEQKLNLTRNPSIRKKHRQNVKLMQKARREGVWKTQNQSAFLYRRKAKPDGRLPTSTGWMYSRKEA